MNQNARLASREAIWPERDINQKLEALRQQVLCLTSIIEDWRDLLSKLAVHQHSENGALVLPLRYTEERRLHSPYIPMGLRDKE